MLKNVKKFLKMLRNIKTIKNLEIVHTDRRTDRPRCRVACTRLKTDTRPDKWFPKLCAGGQGQYPRWLKPLSRNSDDLNKVGYTAIQSRTVGQEQ